MIAMMILSAGSFCQILSFRFAIVSDILEHNVMASRRQHRQDSSSTSPSSPSASIDSSSSSLDSCQGHLTNSNAPSRVGSQYQEGGVGELKLLPEETIKGDYQVT